MLIFFFVGNGLLGSYYNGDTLSTLEGQRVDATINLLNHVTSCEDAYVAER